MIPLHSDFKEFFRSLNAHQVEYLLVGGYAVGHYGYPRATGDLDVWVEMSPDNAQRVTQSLREFGFNVPELKPELFLVPDQIIRMGVAPLKIELFTTIKGLDYSACRPNRQLVMIDDLEIPIVGLEDLKAAKRAAGRLKDLADLEHLP